MSAHHSDNAVRYLLIDSQSHGQRLDNFLMRELKGLPRSAVYRIIRRGEVRVNKGRARPTTRLSEGDNVRIPPLTSLKPVSQTPVTDDFTPRILFEDEHILAIDKPAGLAVHSGSGIQSGIIERLRSSRPQNPYLELVHRIDRNTSGCLLIAKTRPALVRLHERLRDHDAPDVLRKFYTALLVGDLGGSRRVDQPLDDNGVARQAISTFRPRKHLGAFTLTQVELHTGRKHQVRRHAQAIALPLAGDERYGDFQVNRQLRKLGLRRMFLHASRIVFRHPMSDQQLDLSSPLPDDLEACLLAITPGADELI